jgi:pimeloyl-ACP methyl ester carboxylesterase
MMAPAAVAQTTEGRAISGDLEVYYQIHGQLSSGITPLLVLHGGMGSIEGDFGALLQVLATQCPVIGLEQQGHGRTGGRVGPVSMAGMRADSLAILDALDVERVHVIGFSMGGMLAMDLGVAAPERLATLTAISVSQNLDGMHPAIVQVNRNPEAAPSPEALDLMPTQEDFARMQEGFAENPGGLDQFGRTMAQLQSFMVSGWGWSDDELSSISVPSLIILGDNDFTTVGHAERMSGLAQAQLAVLPDTTHLSIMGRPDWLAPLIENRIKTAEN